MAFETGEVNAASGGLKLIVNTFTDTDAVARTMPYSGLAYGDIDAIPTIVSTSNGLPVAQQGTWTVQPGNTANTTAWLVTGTGGTFPVTGTFWQATQPVSAASLPLPSGAATSANQTTELASLASIDGKITAVNTGDVVVSSSALPSGAATAAKQPALGTAGTSSADVITIQGRSGMTAVVVDGSAVTQPVSIAGTVTVASHAVTNAGTFVVQVDGTALTRLTDIETNTDSLAIVGNGAAATAQRVTLANDSTGIVALTTSTASIGKLASNTGVTIGAVEIAAAQTLATVTTVSTVTTCSTVTTLTGGGVAHDAADSGNPHKIGAKATASVLGETPVAANDRTDIRAGTDGVLIQRPHASLEDIISERVTNTDGASTAMTGAFAATASQRIYLTSLFIANSSASFCTVDIRDGAAGAVLATIPVPATGGFVHAFPVPLRFSSNTALAYDASAATSTLTISVIGFKSKA